MSLTKYKVELEGYRFTTYTDGSGAETLAKPLKGGSPKIRTGLTVEAHSPEEAQGIFMAKLGIKGTERNFTVEEVKAVRRRRRRSP